MILQRLMGNQFYNAMNGANGFVAGGAIRSVFGGESINDFDIFFHSREDFDRCVQSMAESDNSPTFTTTDTAWTHCGEKMRYQLICAEFGTPEEIIRKFDFTMCMAAWVPKQESGEFVFDPLFLRHVAQKRLVFNANGKFPICSLWRAQKFIKRGWKLPAIESIKLALCINNLKLADRKELKRQLLGIDTLFLKELTDALDKDAAVAYDFGEAISFLSSFAEADEEPV